MRGQKVGRGLRTELREKNRREGVIGKVRLAEAVRQVVKREGKR